jgi:hypothetical protein
MIRSLALLACLAGCDPSQEVLTCAPGAELMGTACVPIEPEPPPPTCPEPRAGARIATWTLSSPAGLGQLADVYLTDDYSPERNHSILLVQQRIDGVIRIGLRLAVGELIDECPVLGATAGSLREPAVIDGATPPFDLDVPVFEGILTMRDMVIDEIVTDENGQLASLRFDAIVTKADADEVLIRDTGMPLGQFLADAGYEGTHQTDGFYDEWRFSGTWTLTSALVNY